MFGWINLGIDTSRGCIHASIKRITPRRNWTISFNDSKGTTRWINLGIATTILFK
jgi:hypothetical protein